MLVGAARKTAVCCGIGRCGRGWLFHFGSIVLEDMAVATQLHRVEVSSGKCDVHFQTAVFSVGFEVDAIEHERSSRFKRFNINSQRMQTDQVA